MTIKCPVCGAHVPEDVGVQLVLEGSPRTFCSARCADTAVSGGSAFAPVAPLPPAPRRILVAVDGSGPSLRAVAMAARMAALTRGEIRLLCAVESRWTGSLRMLARQGGQPDISGEVERALREDAQAQLDHCRRIAEQAGVGVTAEVIVGPAFEAIVEAAGGADLIVMGSRGRGALSGLLLGSLSQRVLGGTRTPLLVVH